MQTGHGVLQGYHRQALVEANSQVIRQAEAVGNGQDEGPVARRVEGTNAHLKASGLAAKDCEGTRRRADSHDPSAAKRTACAPDQLAADIPDPPVRHRDPRCATHERHPPPPEETFRVAEFPDTDVQDCYTCPQGKLLPLEARRHKRGTHR